MVTLLGDVHFWTLREDVIVKDPDIGAYRYQEKGPVHKERLYYNQRKNYIESRLGTIVLKNTRPSKLRDSLKELDEILVKEKVVLEEWISSTILQMFFSSGILVFITLDITTGDILNITMDKYLQGKLISENIVSAAYCAQSLIFTYNESKATIVNLGRSFVNKSLRTTTRLSTLDVKITTSTGIGPTGRRFERQISVNCNQDLVAIWWITAEDEVYPWTPLNKEKDRANILVYDLSSGVFRLLCYCRTELPPLSVHFSRTKSNHLLTVEQGFDQKGGVTVLNCIYEVQNGSLIKTSTTAIPLEAPLAAHAHNPQQNALLMACNNGVLALHCESKGMTHLTKAGLIPSDIAWLSSGTLLLVSNDRGQIQCFDMSLSLIRLQLQLEDYNPVRILDLSDHFCHQQYLSKLSCAPLPQEPGQSGQSPCIPPVMIHLNGGPLALIRFGTAQCNQLQPHCTRSTELSLENLTKQFIKHAQFDEAINLLVSLNWDTEGSTAVKCLSWIVSALMKLPLTTQREIQLETALASFFVPSVPFNEQVEHEFSPAVRALTRRFFFKVLRRGLLEKAYRLALDLKDYDCFLNVHHVARRLGNKQIASLSIDNAREIESGSCYSDCSSFCSGHSGSCSSHSEFCSTCSSSESETDVLEGRDGNTHEISLEENSHEAADFTSEQTDEPLPRSKEPPPKPQRKPVPQPALSPLKEADTVKDILWAEGGHPSLVASEKASFFVDEEALRKQYEQVIFHEVTTEEEDGGTVKVVHFGVV